MSNYTHRNIDHVYDEKNDALRTLAKRTTIPELLAEREVLQARVDLLEVQLAQCKAAYRLLKEHG